jgi:hypothetical protein
MRQLWIGSLVATLLVLGACSGDTKSSADDVAVPVDVTADERAQPDVVTDATTDVEPQDLGDDTVASPFPLPELTEPVPFRAAFAASMMPAPLGSPTCGFAPGSKPPSPYSDQFPGSKHAYQFPTIRVAVLEGGTERMLFVRLDLIGVNTLFVERIARDLSDVTGYDWSGKVIAGATHTHSSAGRLGDGAIWGLMADTFFPALFERMVSTSVDLAVEAILAMQPSRFGSGVVETDALHNDRRCENPELTDDRVHLLRFDDEEGNPFGLIMVHSVHGTILDPEDRSMSRDAVGGIEERVKESFDTPVEVFFLQAGAGDMSPDDAEFDTEGDLPDIDHKYSRMEGLGVIAGEVVQSAFWDIETSAEVPLTTRSFYVPLGRDIIGYEDGIFPFEGGGAYCGSTYDSECWSGEPTPIEGLDKMCLDIKMLASGMGIDEAAPDRTMVSAGLIGDLLIITYPGEPVTQCTLDVEEGVRALFPSQAKIIVLGYSQDYIGYSVPEWDFYQGGYEASGALWGPKQGDHITAHAIEVGSALLDGTFAVPYDDPGPFPQVETADATFADTYCKNAGIIVTEPAANVTAGETVVFEFNGGSPWLLLPDVVLEQEVDGVFEPVTRPNGSIVNSLGYEYFIQVLPDPTYEDNLKIQTRTFTWHFELPTDRRVSTAIFPLAGTYRFHATGSYLPQNSLQAEDYDLTSKAFTVE